MSCFRWVALCLSACSAVCFLPNTGQSADIFWVSALKSGVEYDAGYVQLLEAAGHTVEKHYDDMAGSSLSQAQIDAMNAADVVVVSRSVSSGDYNTVQWNTVTSPLMLMTPYLTRSNRWMWMDTTDAGSQLVPQNLVAADPNHPIFGGLSVVNMIDETKIAPENNAGQVTNGVSAVGNGTLLASSQDTGWVWSAYWDAGTEFYNGSGQVAGGPRLFFSFGNQEPSGSSFYGGNNSTPEGEMIFVNSVNYLAAIPEPSSLGLLSIGCLALLGRRRREDR